MFALQSADPPHGWYSIDYPPVRPEDRHQVKTVTDTLHCQKWATVDDAMLKRESLPGRWFVRRV